MADCQMTEVMSTEVILVDRWLTARKGDPRS